MNERVIITMPIAPYKEFSVGKMTTPILAEALSKKTNSRFVLATNLLDSYQERSLIEYQTLLKAYNINPDEYWIDQEKIEQLTEKIYYLIDKGFITKKNNEILSCNCKKVEISKHNLLTINLNDACFEIRNNIYYCKSCQSKCNLESKDVLIFNPNLIQDKNIIFYPEFINRDIKTFFNTVASNEIVISRERETGIEIQYENEKYNIDIDFLWQIYLSLFNNQEKIVLCSNHQLYQLFMVGMLEKCFPQTGKTICLATPYLNIKDKQKELELKDRQLSLKLFVLLSQKWSRKENNFDDGVLKYINNMNVDKKQQLYEIVMEESCKTSLEIDLKRILTKDFNIQNANAKLKKRRKSNV